MSEKREGCGAHHQRGPGTIRAALRFARVPQKDEPGFGFYCLVLLMVVMWSANYIVGKIALREFPPLLIVGLRMLGSGLVMIPIWLTRRRAAGQPQLTRRDLPLLLGLGILGVGLNQLLFVVGLSQTSVAHAAIMIALTPMLILLLAAWTGQERLNGARLLGMAIALAGVATLQLTPAAKQAGGLVGDLLVFLAGLMFAVFTVTGKATMGRLGGVAMNTFAYVGSAVAMAPFTWYIARDFPFPAVSGAAWLSLIYMAVFPSIVGYLIYYYALARIPASRLSAFTYLQPLLATLMAIPALGEYPTRSLLVGGLLVVTGVFVAERV